MATVQDYLRQMASSDPDIRYMSLNDLIADVQRPNWSVDDTAERNLVDAVLNLVQDVNTEVRNIAVQCLGRLARKASQVRLQHMIERLCQMVARPEQVSMREVAGLGLKLVVMEIPAGSEEGVFLCSLLIPRILVQLKDPQLSTEAQKDQLDLLVECLERFGPVMEPTQLAEIQSVALPLMDNQRSNTRKRVTVVIGRLSRYTSDQLFSQLIDLLKAALKAPNHRSAESTNTAVSCLNSIANNCPHRLVPYFDELIPLLLEHAKVEDNDDLNEQCLQTLEIFTLRCSSAIRPYLTAIVDLCVAQIAYDPNYADDEDVADMDEDEDDKDDDEDGEDDEDYYEDNYSDEDDESWKVRRGATKTLTALVDALPDQLDYFYSRVAPQLVKRFGEREETVRVEVLRCYISLLRQTTLQVTNASDAQARQTYIALPAQLVPQLCQKLTTQLNGKSVAARHVSYTLLSQLVRALGAQSLTAEQLAPFVPALAGTLSMDSDQQQKQNVSTHLLVAGSDLSIKMEALQFVRQMLHQLPLAVYADQLERLVPALCVTVDDRFYKVSAEALSICSDLIAAVAAQGGPAALLRSDILYATLLRHVRTLDNDQEVRERAVQSLGALCARFGGDIPLAEALAVLLDRCSNEGTQSAALQALRDIILGPTVGSSAEVGLAVKNGAASIIQLVKTGPRPTKIAALSGLIASQQVHCSQISPDLYMELVTACRTLINDSDLQLLALSLQCCTTLIRQVPSLLDYTNGQITGHVQHLVPSSSVHGAAQEAVLQYYTTLAEIDPAHAMQRFSGLFEPVSIDSSQPVTKQAYLNVARCAAACCRSVNLEQTNIIPNLVAQSKKCGNTEALRCISLQTLGEIGRRHNLAAYPNLATELLALLADTLDDVKSAAAYALGNLTAGNLAVYLPILVSEIKQGDARRYLLLSAIKETISRSTDQQSAAQFSPYADGIWELLFAEDIANKDEAAKNVEAECIGRLTLLDPAKFLPQLQARMQSSSASSRATAIAAVKFTFTGVHSASYADLLRPMLVEFLSLMKDGDLTVRYLSLATFNSAAHNKPQLVRAVLDQLLPLLYDATIIRSELIHIVDMGPFKHQVDEGLDVRKSAYECMCTLLEGCADRIDFAVFLDRVVAALSDQHDIQVLAYLMLARMLRISPAAIAQRMEDISKPLHDTITFKLKENAVKQEVEKHHSLVRAALRAIASLSSISDANTMPKFDALLRDIRAGPLADKFRAAVAETEQREQYRLTEARTADDAEHR